jgi:hypothetical protein
MFVDFFNYLFFFFCNLSILIDVQRQKKIDTNQIQCSQLLLHNQELKTKCDLLQEKLENLERNNIRLIQRWTQQVKFFFSFYLNDLVFFLRIFVHLLNVQDGFQQIIVFFFGKKFYY